MGQQAIEGAHPYIKLSFARSWSSTFEAKYQPNNV